MIPGELFVEPGDGGAERGPRVRACSRSAEHGRSTNPGRFPLPFYRRIAALRFDRDRALGFRLDIPAGTAVRFEPGQERTIELVAYGGHPSYYGFNAKVMDRLP